MSHNRDFLQTKLPENVFQSVGIDRVDGSAVVLKDGSVVEPDTVMFCTGYRFAFPFFSDDDAIVSIDEHEIITPLYKHLVNIKYPSLFFVGIVNKICPFPLFDCQIKLITRVLSGDISLPTDDVMYEDMNAERVARLNEGLPPRYGHTMGPKQWLYNDELATIGSFQQIPRVVETLYDAVHCARTQDLCSYKNKRYELIDDTKFKEIC